MDLGETVGKILIFCNVPQQLNGASINEEHRSVMSAVIQKVLSAKSGLTEACTSLLTGFEVRKTYKNVTA